MFIFFRSVKSLIRDTDIGVSGFWETKGDQHEKIGQKGHVVSWPGLAKKKKRKTDGKAAQFPSVFTRTLCTSTILLARRN